MSGGLQQELFGPGAGQMAKALLLRAARQVVDRVGTKVAAADLDRGASVLSNQLAERDRHRLTLDDLAELVGMDDLGSFTIALCELQGFEPPVRREALDDTAKLTRLLRSLAKAGPAGAAIVNDAFGEGK